MAKRYSAKTLIKELGGHIDASKAQLTVKFGESTIPLLIPGAGIVSGDDYGILKIGAAIYYLEIDRKGTNKTLKVIEPDAAKVAQIAKQLLPEPEEPAEVKAAREALASFAVPKGYKLVLDGKGKPTIVEADAPIRAPRGSAAPKEDGAKLPAIIVGLKVARSKALDRVFMVTGVNLETGTATLKPEDGGENEEVKLMKGDGTNKATPVNSRHWKAV